MTGAAIAAAQHVIVAPVDAPHTTVRVRRVISYRRFPEGERRIDNSVELGAR